MSVEAPYAKRRVNRCRHRSLVSLEDCAMENTPSSSATFDRKDTAFEAIL